MPLISFAAISFLANCVGGAPSVDAMTACGVRLTKFPRLSQGLPSPPPSPASGRGWENPAPGPLSLWERVRVRVSRRAAWGRRGGGRAAACGSSSSAPCWRRRCADRAGVPGTPPRGAASRSWRSDRRRAPRWRARRPPRSPARPGAVQSRKRHAAASSARSANVCSIAVAGVPQAELAHAGRVNQAAAARQLQQLAPRRRVAPLRVAHAHRARREPIAAQQRVDQARLAGARRSHHRARRARRQQRPQRLDAGARRGAGGRCRARRRSPSRARAGRPSGSRATSILLSTTAGRAPPAATIASVRSIRRRFGGRSAVVTAKTTSTFADDHLRLVRARPLALEQARARQDVVDDAAARRRRYGNPVADRRPDAALAAQPSRRSRRPHRAAREQAERPAVLHHHARRDQRRVAQRFHLRLTLSVPSQTKPFNLEVHANLLARAPSAAEPFTSVRRAAMRAAAPAQPASNGAPGLVEVDDQRRVIRRDRLALARLAIDLGPHDARGDRRASPAGDRCACRSSCGSCRRGSPTRCSARARGGCSR